MSKNFLHKQVCIQIVTILGIVATLMWPVISATSDSTNCKLPDSTFLGDSGVKFTAEQEITLQKVDLLDKIKWSFSPFIPSLIVGSTIVHLYDDNVAGNFLKQFSNIEDTKLVKFFYVCEINDKYEAVMGRVSKEENNSSDASTQNESQNGYLGMSFRPRELDRPIDTVWAYSKSSLATNMRDR